MFKVEGGIYFCLFLIACLIALTFLYTFNTNTIIASNTRGLNWLYLNSELTISQRYNGNNTSYPNGTYQNGVGIIVMELNTKNDMCLIFMHELGHKECYPDKTEECAINYANANSWRCETI